MYLCDTGICHSVCVASGLLVGFSVWVASSLLVGLKLQQADQTPPIQSDKYQCRKDTAIFLLLTGTQIPEICIKEK